MARISLLVLSFSFLTLSICAQSGTKKPGTKVTLPAIAAIRPSELEADLAELTHDRFRGREAGTPDELKASAWLAERARKAGLTPAGDDSTFFQFFSVKRNRIAPSSMVLVDSNHFRLWEDVLVTQTAPVQISAPVLLLNSINLSDADTTAFKGKAVVIMASPAGVDLDISLPERRYPTFLFRKYSPTLLNNGAAAIIFIADTLGEKSWSAVMPAVTRGLYDIEGGPNASASPKPPVLWFHNDALAHFKKSGAVLHVQLNVESFEYPSVNVVGMVRGNDPSLRNEYVLYSGHQDHDGVRTPYGNDSVYNGADDNASACVAMLAIARTFRAEPAKRSVLFVWHGAEERGLLGSKWFSSHPTVPPGSITAVLNADMIGRNHPDTAALLGSTAPHMNSRDLVNMALEANADGPKFVIDSSWDNPQHPEFWYFRSDHLPYARAGIPALFFTSLLHPDYHTPMDEMKSIDMKKLTRMTQWLYRTGAKAANAARRPRSEENFRLER
jgi:hypothetical protein